MVGGSSIPTRRTPGTELQAKFSVQYVVARALLDGAVKLEHFEEAAISEAAVTDLLARMQAKAHPDMPDDADSQWAAEVVVHTTDGRRLAQSHRQPDGRWRRHPEQRLRHVGEIHGLRRGGASARRHGRRGFFERLETLESASDMRPGAAPH